MAPKIPVTPLVEQLGPGLWSIPVPIPDNPLGYTLVYLLESDRGPVLVDAGWDDPATWQALTDGVAASGAAVGDVYGVLVTHYHPDHHGLAGAVREASGAWIAMHPADTHIVKRQRSSSFNDSVGWVDKLGHILHAAGVPEEEMAALSDVRNRVVFEAPVLPDREIADDELADVPGWQVRAVWTPGHSPGHTCFHLEKQHLLLAGDHLLPGITPHVGLYEMDRFDSDSLGDFLGSLHRIAKLNPAGVLPAHQHRFADATARTEEILRHHEDRLARLEAQLAGEPMTPWQIAEGMEWNRPWDQISPMMRQVALSEAAAHLRHLIRLGRAEVVPGSTPVRFQASGTG
jgi:glyoxylase-like metal-dependent hydrolase (beta-lactamase superfamily II)